MKRWSIWTVGAVLCAAALLAGSAWLLLRTAGSVFPDEGKYTVGGAVISVRVDNLDIHWTSGAVTVAFHDADTVEFSETASRPLTEDESLRWYLEGTTLHIRYAKPRLASLRAPDKALTVTLPEGIFLDRTEIDVTSGTVNVPWLRTGAFAADLTSGELRAELAETKNVTVDATSGTIDLTLTGRADSVRLTGTSADIRASLGDVETLRAAATSGSVRVGAANVGRAEFGSTSGEVSIALDSFRELEIGTTSGNVTAALPVKAGFRAEIRTTSGRVESDIPLRQSGRSYACGDESGEAEISTTSGDVRLKER